MDSSLAITVNELAEFVGGAVQGDGSRVIRGACALDKAGPSDMTFLESRKLLKVLAASRAAAVLISPALLQEVAPGKTSPAFIIVDHPQQAFVRLMVRFRPPRPRGSLGVSPQAYVSPSARIGAGTNVFPGAYVGDDVVIGENCDIHPGAAIGAGCRLGDEVVLHPHVVLYPDVEVGSRVIIHASAVIGADGFGYRLVDGRHQRVPHLGTVRIADDVEIGACTTVDRAMIGATVIGEGTKLDNLVMIAHNCEIGRHNAIVSQVGFAGSVTTGDYVICAGQVGVADHVHIGEQAIIGSKAGVHKDVPAGETYIGQPAQPASEAMKVAMSQRKIPEIRKSLKTLEARLDELAAQLAALQPAAAPPNPTAGKAA